MAQGLAGALLVLTRGVTTVAMVAACAMLVIAVGAGGYQILARFVLHEPSEWTEVIVRFALIWMVFLATPIENRLATVR